MNPPYVLANIAKNALVALLGDALTRRGSLGLETRPELITDTLKRIGDILGPSAVELEGELVYELGPGRTPYLMIAMALSGANRVVGLDVRNWMTKDFKQSQLTDRLIVILNTDDTKSFRQAFEISEESLQRNLRRFDHTSPIRYKIFSGSQIEEKEDSIGFLYSKSVLEHINISQLEVAIQDQFRVLKPGALALHIIDLRDHLHIDGDHKVEGDWLDALRYPEWLHRAQTSNRRAYINRLRANDWLKLFKSQGFELVEWRLRHNALPSHFKQARLSKEFRSVNEDFSISWIEALLRKPA